MDMRGNTIRAMSPEAKLLLRIYGDHRQRCAKRRLIASVRYDKSGNWSWGWPECDCGWLEVLGQVCTTEKAVDLENRHA